MPRKADDVAKVTRVEFRMTWGERQELERWALLEGKTVSELVRERVFGVGGMCARCRRVGFTLEGCEECR